ncbi:MAG TPA: hypothetical protein VG759_12320 [Candidatus Angelobacter sp.]|jgi:hypothetical protein|nr:hypothetical protein [Candidatus Angelobacter sp.]
MKFNPSRSWFFLPVALLVIAAVVVLQAFYPANNETTGATYSHGVLHIAIPYKAVHAGAGQLTVEVLDPEDQILGRAQHDLEVAEGKGRWQ